VAALEDWHHCPLHHAAYIPATASPRLPDSLQMWF
jgi:hypothetical protein